MIVTPNTNHPAKWTPRILTTIAADVLRPESQRLGRPLAIVDVFAGVGRIHSLAVGAYRNSVAETVGVELEPEWAACHRGTIVGDATDLAGNWSGRFDAVVTSGCYGNRYADHQNAKDRSKRYGYKFSLGRDPSPGSAAVMQWGDAYRELHARAIDEMIRVVREPTHDEPGGLIVVNMKNHFRTLRKGEPPTEQRVVEWWFETMVERGLTGEQVIVVPVRGQRHGQNHGHRDDDQHAAARRKPHEHVLVMRRSA